jgi:hypothetical protein
MDRTQKGEGRAKARAWRADEGEGQAEANERRQAAAYLRAARLTDDATEREELRRKAADLLSPDRRTRKPGSREPR